MSTTTSTIKIKTLINLSKPSMTERFFNDIHNKTRQIPVRGMATLTTTKTTGSGESARTETQTEEKEVQRGMLSFIIKFRVLHGPGGGSVNFERVDPRMAAKAKSARKDGGGACAEAAVATGGMAASA